MKRLVIIIGAALLLSNPSFSQDELGMTGSNYSPATTLRINPSSIVDSWAYMDIHLAGIGVSVHNNFTYLADEAFKTSQMWKDPESISDPEFNRNNGPYYGYVSATVQGPTLSMVLGKSSIAVFTAGRSITSTSGISNQLANYMVEGFTYTEQLDERYREENVRLSSLTWAEAGLSFGRILKARGNSLVSGGVTLKRLFGVSGAGIHLKEWDYSVLSSDSLETYALDGEYGFNEPGWNTGSGWSTDIGITFKKTLDDMTGYTPHSPSSGCKKSKYLYKLGFSLLDIGYLAFDPVFYNGTFSLDDVSVWENYDDVDPDDESEISNLLEEEFASSGSDDSGEKRSLRMMLPATASVQYDRLIKGNFYLNSTLVQGIPTGNNLSPKRMAQLSLTPRFETKRFEASVPIVLRKYREPSVGVALRLNSIIIGSDRIGGLLFGGDVYGADIYFHFKYTIFRRSACKGKGNTKPVPSGPSRVEGVSKPCPVW